MRGILFGILVVLAAFSGVTAMAGVAAGVPGGFFLNAAAWGVLILILLLPAGKGFGPPKDSVAEIYDIQDNECEDEIDEGCGVTLPRPYSEESLWAVESAMREMEREQAERAPTYAEEYLGQLNELLEEIDERAEALREQETAEGDTSVATTEPEDTSVVSEQPDPDMERIGRSACMLWLRNAGEIQARSARAMEVAANSRHLQKQAIRAFKAEKAWVSEWIGTGCDVAGGRVAYRS